MAEDEPIPPELGEQYLPYDTEFLTAACTAYATLIEIDDQLISKGDAKKLGTAKSKLLEVIVASAHKIHEDYFS